MEFITDPFNPNSNNITGTNRPNITNCTLNDLNAITEMNRNFEMRENGSGLGVCYCNCMFLLEGGFLCVFLLEWGIA